MPWGDVCGQGSWLYSRIFYSTPLLSMRQGEAGLAAAGPQPWLPPLPPPRHPEPTRRPLSMCSWHSVFA